MTQIETSSVEKDPLEVEIEAANRVLEYAEAEMRKTAPVLLRLLQKRHELYEMAKSQLTKAEPIDEQLYPDPFYNDAFTVEDLRVRTGPEYHKESEKYDPVLNTYDEDGNRTPEKDDTPADLAIKKEFRHSVLGAGQELGYVSPYIGESEDETERHIGMLPSTLEKIDRKLEAIVIPGAAGISNLIRVQDAFRNIKSGAVDTDTIIFAAGERPAGGELATVERLGYRLGQTEFEQAVFALEDIGQVQFEEGTEKIPAGYGENIPDSTVKRGEVVINDKIIKVIVVEGAYDRERKDARSGQPADRAITSETFRAIMPFLSDNGQPVLIDSHDTWGKGQEIVAQEILGLEANKEVLATWAFKSDRVYLDENGQPDIVAAQGVIDEIGKTHFNLVRLKVAALNKLKALEDAKQQR